MTTHTGNVLVFVWGAVVVVMIALDVALWGRTFGWW
jgi:hypothetical protein